MGAMAQYLVLAVNISMALVVLGLALKATWYDITYLLRRPGLLVRSLVAMNLVMPLFAALAVAIFDLPLVIKVTLIALALSPVPPILPQRQERAGGAHPYVIGLLAITAACSIVVVPLGAEIIGAAFGREVQVPMTTVARVVGIGVILPLLLGVAVREFAPAFAERIARWVSLAGTVLLIASFLPVLVGVYPDLMSLVGNGTLAALAAFTIVGVAVGHALAGPWENNRVVLALASGTRHPGVAMAMVAAIAPDEKGVIAAVLWHLIVGAIVSAPYVRWRKRFSERASSAAPPSPEKAGPDGPRPTLELEK